MTIRVYVALVVGLCITGACTTNPDVAKRKYLERGNLYFDKEKYKEAMIMYRNALKKDPKFGDAYYRVALTELKMDPSLRGQLVAARDLQRAVEFLPDNMDAYDKLIDIYLRAYLVFNKPKSYIADLKTIQDRLRKRNPNSYQVARLSGYLALTEEKRKDAIQFFQQANAIKPFQPDVILVLMQTMEQEGQKKESEALAYEMLSKNPRVPSIYDALFIRYLKEQRYQDAEGILKRLIAAMPESTDGYIKLAANYYSQRRPDDMNRILQSVLDDPKRLPDGNRRVGDFYIRVRDFDNAYRAYSQGIERHPEQKVEFEKSICEVYAQQGKFKEANDLVTQILKANPKDDEAIGIRAALKLNRPSRDDVQSAINDLQAVLSRVPKERTAVLHYNLGRAYALQQDMQQARIQFEAALTIRPDYMLPRLALGEVYLKSGDYGKVLQLTDEVVKLDPYNVAARLQRTRALIGTQNFNQARQELMAISKEYPQVWDAKLQLAALDNTANPAAAEETFREIIAKTGDIRAVSGLADNYVRRNRFDDAIQLLRTQSARAPQNPYWHIQIGNVAVHAHRFDVALAEYREVLKQNPRDWETWLRVGEMQRTTGDIQGAVASFKKAADIAPKNSKPLLELGMIYDSMNQRNEATATYQTVLQLEPDNPIALNNLAYNYVQRGVQLDEALNMAQRAHQRLPGNTDVADTLGWVYLRKSLNDSAIEVFRDVVRRSPKRALYRLHLGMALAAKGSKVEAKKELGAALQLNPQKDEESQIRELLGKLG